MSQSAPNGQQDLGPSKRWILHLIAINPLTYVTAAVAVFGLSANVRKYLYVHADTMPAARGWLLSLYRFLHDGPGWWWVFGSGALVVVIAAMIWQSHAYRLDESFLYKRTGLLGTFDDPIALCQVIDANMPKNIFQRIFGCGDLIIVVVDRPRQSRNVRFYYVANPDDVRQFILDRCGGRTTRMII